jgi:hypothetical protein
LDYYTHLVETERLRPESVADVIGDVLDAVEEPFLLAKWKGLRDLL